VNGFLFEHGFDLLYLNRVFASRTKFYEGPSRGQMLFGDALYGRRVDLLGGQTVEKKIKMILLLINYWHVDIAHQLLKSSAECEATLPDLANYFKIGRPRFLRRWKKSAISWLEKSLCVALHLRKHNQLAMDSDRSWPIR